ncbi:carbohydrate kinase [Fulvivirgaceae bacterium PWU4]|uniref:Carbohydrate kinase n=1 Tax=Chryseosolibacter histidini TaxID=2782349 RepID=A0AAP2DQ50_9BACT|nr:FGGY family carbohydrate kinase [Chryseosolibacter histidini]MBT1700421.1 carbohydrate kinase [Chryseosolibacter histidini]
MTTSVIAVFDAGKTNKKLFLFDEAYNIVFERSAQFEEIRDEDGDPCEDLESLTTFVKQSLDEVVAGRSFDVKAVNFATYGASFVNISKDGKPVTPLYNYLKPYPEALKKKFYDAYGGDTEFAFTTASPVLGSLNSGMQLYRLKHEKPAVFQKIQHALHLPQYLSFLLTGKVCTDITSIGCHTNLWDFKSHQYHRWVQQEGIEAKLPPLVPSDSTVTTNVGNKNCPVGVGLHDSSAALIPYLVNFHEPFVLISTGTWCISLNPFNPSPLTAEELASDCLCYLQYKGTPVKASRLFAGYIHDHQVERIAAHFHKAAGHFKSVSFDRAFAQKMKKEDISANAHASGKDVTDSVFEKRDLSDFNTAEEAYHQLMFDLVTQQRTATQRVIMGTSSKRIFVDGGFGKNDLYMNFLAAFFPGAEVYAASMPQATAMGAALAIDQVWNKKPLPKDLIHLKHYSAVKEHQL